MPDTTWFNISGPGVTPYSARGLTQTLEPIAQASQLRRTINGGLIDVSAPQFRKYRSTVSSSDHQPPAFDNRWPGLQLTVDCAKEMAYLTAGGSPGRTVVPGSLRTEGDYTFYRPRMVMRVVNYSMAGDEWQAGEQWSLELEEV